MRVGMDLAMHERLVQVAAHDRLGQRRHVLLGAAQAADVGGLGALHEFHGQHPARRQVPDRLRHEQARIAFECAPKRARLPASVR